MRRPGSQGTSGEDARTGMFLLGKMCTLGSMMEIDLRRFIISLGSLVLCSSPLWAAPLPEGNSGIPSSAVLGTASASDVSASGQVESAGEVNDYILALEASGAGNGSAASDQGGMSMGPITTHFERAFAVRAALGEFGRGQVPHKVVRDNLERMLTWGTSDDLFVRSACARTKAEAAAFYIMQDPVFAQTLMRSAEGDLQEIESWLSDYGRIFTVHGFEEPRWVQGRPEVVAQAVLAWVAMEKVSPSNERRQCIAKFSEGLQKLLRGSYSRYPFGAHYSYLTSEAKPASYLVPGSDAMVPGASIIVEQNYVASALAEAATLLNDSGLADSAEREGLGLLAHLALSGNIPYDFAPRPEYEVRSPLAVAAVVENLTSLRRLTGKPVFGTLAGCAAIESAKLPDGAVCRIAKRRIKEELVAIGAAEWLGAEDIRPPMSGIVVELEDGKAVQKAFDVYPVTYLGGTPGKLAVVGKDNMFWMRFDVDRGDQYFFHLCFMKSDVSGGLVSVMVRIDGDQIFQVNLGGATDDPFVDVDLVAGPRELRQGPHSFGIRFSGLLMKKPAVLDSILVEPAVQRRWVSLRDGRSILLLNSNAEENLNIRLEELEGGAATSGRTGDGAYQAPADTVWTSVTGLGHAAAHKLTRDRRGRVRYAMPAGGVTTVTWPGSIPGLKREE